MERDLAQSFVSILSSRVTVILVGVITTPILVRLLGSTGYGDYALVISAVGLILPLLASGTFNGMRKYLAEERSVTGWRSAVFGFYVRITFFLCLVAAAIVLTAIHTGLVTTVFGGRFRTYFILMVLLLTARAFKQVSRGALMGFGLERYSEPLNVLERVLFAVVALSLVYLGWGVTGALIGALTAAGTAVVLSSLPLKPRLRLGAVFQGLPNGTSPRELLSFGFYSVLLGFLTVSLYHVDVLLLQPMSGSSETGHYKAALVIAEFIWLVPTAIQYALVQSVSDLWSRGERDRVENIVGRAVRYSSALVLLLLIGVGGLATHVIPVYYGSEFQPAIVPFYLLLPGVLGFALARPVFATGQGIGRIKTLVGATGVAAVGNLALNILLIPKYGMEGAATATSLSYGSMFFLHVLAARRIGYDPLEDLRPGRLAATALLSAPVIFGLAHLLTSPLAALLVVPPVGFAVYGTLAIRFRVLDPEELEAVVARGPKFLEKDIMEIVQFIRDL